jgi:hypothetical protein
MGEEQKRNTSDKWREAEKEYRRQVRIGKRWYYGFSNYFINLFRLYPYKILRVKSTFKALMPFNLEKPIENITQYWLTMNNFAYDRLMVEQGSEEVADPSAHVHNRFYASRVIPIRYFVEDDAIKAQKLAYICDIVFLIDHPYNQNSNLPSNVIRVNSWNEIHQHMRILC